MSLLVEVKTISLEMRYLNNIELLIGATEDGIHCTQVDDLMPTVMTMSCGVKGKDNVKNMSFFPGRTIC